MRKVITILILASIIAMAAVSAGAAEKKFEASLDRTAIALGETAQLGLSFYGTQSMPAPDIGNVDGLEIRYMGPSTMMTVINGQMSSSITHMYKVLPLKLGHFQLGPFSFKYKNDSYVSNNVVLEVGEEKPGPQAAASPSMSVDEQRDLKDRIFLVLEVDKAAAYVNELIPVSVKLYVNRMNVSDIQLPTFSQEGFSKVDFKEPKQSRETLNGILYDTLEFKTKIFGTKAGAYRLGPAKIKCNIVVRKAAARRPGNIDDFFSSDPARDSFFEEFFTRNERYPVELKSQDVQLVISPLPADGRPKDFSGAVGDYQFIFDASPTKLKTGDPITLRMTINGRGNFNTVLAPRIENADGFKVYEPQVKTEESRKTFTQVLIPATEALAEIPSVTFNYFDPDRKIYKTIAQGKVPIQVEKPKAEAPSQVIGPISPAGLDHAAEMGELARDIIYIKDSPGIWLAKGRRIYNNRLFGVSLILATLLLISVYVIQNRRSRLVNDATYARRAAAVKFATRDLRQLKHKLKHASPPVFYEELFNILQGYLGNRLGIPVAGVTADLVEASLLGRGLDKDVAAKTKALFHTCDEARFGSSNKDDFKMDTDFRQLEALVNYLERKRL